MDKIAESILSTGLTTVYANTESNSGVVTKEYGNRKFTATYNILCGIGSASITLINHYKLDENGITERYGETSATQLSFFGSISCDSQGTITDKYATKPGGSNTNMYAQYYVTASSGGWNTNATAKIDSVLTYKKINKTKKTITLTQYSKKTY